MDFSALAPGDNHYKAFVGPPTQYDFMGATQFRLLCSLGLRADHYLLDFGCGSLRSGRLFINYLDRNRYFGIEPNKWLIDEAVKVQLGEDILRIKNPQFDYNHLFLTNVFSQKFDFIIAQSIFSHTGIDLIRIALNNFRESLKTNGLIAVTFKAGKKDFDGKGWVYPGCVKYHPNTIREFAKGAGLFITRIPWYHPRQTWYILAKRANLIPNNMMLRHLSGAVLFDPEFAESWKRKTNFTWSFRAFVQTILLQPVKNYIRNLINH